MSFGSFINCEAWHENPLIDPMDEIPIKYGDGMYKYLFQQCATKVTPTISDCDAWIARPNLDPQTGTAISIPDPESYAWQKACGYYKRRKEIKAAVDAKAGASPEELYQAYLGAEYLPTLKRTQPFTDIGYAGLESPLSGEFKTYPCPKLEAILNTICTTQLTQDIYYSFAKYRHNFIKHIAYESGSCYGGELEFTIDKPEFTKAKLTSEALNLDVCAGRSLIVVDISWYPPINRNRTPDEAITSGHAMMLLIDTHNKIIEFFEPNGPDASWVPIMTLELWEYFNDKPEYTGYTFIEPGEDQYCPTSGLQYVSQDRMCANWSLLYAYLRITCPNVPRADLIEMLRSQGQEYLRHLMQQWHCYMWKYAWDNYIIQAVDAERNLWKESLSERKYLDVPFQLEGWWKDLEILRGQIQRAFSAEDYKTVAELGNTYTNLYKTIIPAFDEVRRVEDIRKKLPQKFSYEQIELNSIYYRILDDFKTKQYAKILDDAKEYDRLYKEITTPKPVVTPSWLTQTPFQAATTPAFSFKSIPSIFTASQPEQKIPSTNPFAGFSQPSPFTFNLPKGQSQFSFTSTPQTNPFGGFTQAPFSSQPTAANPFAAFSQPAFT